MPLVQSLAAMPESAYVRLSNLIYQEAGITLPAKKRTLLETRLQRRLRALQLASFEAYCQYLFQPGHLVNELPLLLDAISTNKTDFFREPQHFDYLRQHWLPQQPMGRQVKVWSAGCSTGEEPYTLAMVLAEHLQRQVFDFSIYATDLSTEVLQTACLGIYSVARTADIPQELKRKYLLRGKHANSAQMRVVPELRSKIRWERLNLMDASYSTPDQYDLIFCRNVIIYFDRPTQEAVIQKLCQRLVPGGHLFLGHSESIQGMQVPLQQVRPTIFRHV